jgi:hypothetical protein
LRSYLNEKVAAPDNKTELTAGGFFLFFYLGKKYYKYKKEGLGNAHLAFCSTF